MYLCHRRLERRPGRDRRSTRDNARSVLVALLLAGLLVGCSATQRNHVAPEPTQAQEILVVKPTSEFFPPGSWISPEEFARLNGKQALVSGRIIDTMFEELPGVDTHLYLRLGDKKVQCKMSQRLAAHVVRKLERDGTEITIQGRLATFTENHLYMDGCRLK